MEGKEEMGVIGEEVVEEEGEDCGEEQEGEDCGEEQEGKEGESMVGKEEMEIFIQEVE